MAFLAAAAPYLATAAPYLTAASTALSVAGSLRAGQEAKQQGEIRARELREDANARQAEGQREAIVRRRRGMFAASRARAVAAASGGGVTDTTADLLIGRIEAQSDLQVLNALYEGDTTARGLRDGARIAEREGKAAQRASRYKALGSVLSGAVSFADKYPDPAVKYKTGSVSSGTALSDAARDPYDQTYV